MRAGKLDRSITIQRYTSGVDELGNPAGYIWSDLVTVRAQILQQSTEEFIRGYGASDETAVIFRVRWIDDISNADRIVYQGQPHNLKEIKEIGRRVGLELRCVASGGAL